MEWLPIVTVFGLFLNWFLAFGLIFGVLSDRALGAAEQREQSTVPETPFDQGEATTRGATLRAARIRANRFTWAGMADPFFQQASVRAVTQQHLLLFTGHPPRPQPHRLESVLRI